MSVFGFCDNKCKHEVYAKDNYAVITGNVTTPEADSTTLNGQTTLAYPEGFNQSNCVVLSIMGGKMNDDSTLSTPMIVDTLGSMMGASGLYVTLKDSEIIIGKMKTTTTQGSITTSFKLVLMKVS